MGETLRLRETDLTWQLVGDDIVVLDLDGSVYLRINSTGRVLWETLNDAVTEPQLVETLIDRFGIGRSQAEADVATFLSELRQRGLVTE